MAQLNRTIYLSLFRDVCWEKIISDPKNGQTQGILLLALMKLADIDGRGQIVLSHLKSDIFSFEENIDNSAIASALDAINKKFHDILFYHHRKAVYYQFKN